MGLFGIGGNSTQGGIGYNAQQVNEIGNIINQKAQSISDDIVENIHRDVILPMAQAWYAPEAVTFFENFAKVVASTGSEIKEAFETFRANVQLLGENWAENTGGEKPQLPSVTDLQLNLSVAEIKEKDDAGNVIIYSSAATPVVNSLPEVEASIKNVLVGAANELEVATAFIGGGQSDAIRECFVRIAEIVSKYFKYLTSDDNGNKSLATAINDAVAKYGDVASSNVSGISSVAN